MKIGKFAWLYLCYGKMWDKSMAKNLCGRSFLTIFLSVILLLTGTAFAAGTPAGTNVRNTFVLDHKVAGVDQPTINTAPRGTNTPTEFTVDRRVDLTVASMGNLTVAPGALDQQLVYSLINVGNDVQAYDLSITAPLAGPSGFWPDDINLTYYLDDGNGVFEPGGADGGGLAYALGSGDATIDLPADGLFWLVIDADIDVARVDGDTALVVLVADTLEPSSAASPGSETIADSDGNFLTGVAENVLADGAGTPFESPNAGDHSASGAYNVAAADVTAVKSISIFSQDGTGCTVIPGTPSAGEQYAIPGACIEYVITVANNGASATATEIVIKDILPDELFYINSAVSGDLTGGALTQPSSNANCAVLDCTVSLTGASLAAGQTGQVIIRAQINFFTSGGASLGGGVIVF